MDTQIQAQIYLADQRGYSETEVSRSYHQFNFGQYADESRQPFGALQLVNDDTLRAGTSLRMRVEQNTTVVLIPVTGGLEYRTNAAPDNPIADFIEPGQVQMLALSAGAGYVVSNPYETETINFLQLWLTSAVTDLPAVGRRYGFNLTQKNELLSLFGRPEAGMQGFIGQYEGRQEGVYPAKKWAATGQNGIFVFVLKGAFEVQNRLLHEKDGLALLNVRDGVDFEALSNDAILILLDFPIEPF